MLTEKWILNTLLTPNYLSESLERHFSVFKQLCPSVSQKLSWPHFISCNVHVNFFIFLSRTVLFPFTQYPFNS